MEETEGEEQGDGEGGEKYFNLDNIFHKLFKSI